MGLNQDHEWNNLQQAEDKTGIVWSLLPHILAQMAFKWEIIMSFVFTDYKSKV